MYKIVRIEWMDASSIGEWKTKGELDKEEAFPCISAGFLVKTTKLYYYVANTYSHNDDPESVLTNGIMLIPRKWIIKFEVLLDAD